MSKLHESSARRRLTVYLAGMSLVAIAVAAIGWRLVQEDRALQRQQISDRLETAADVVSVELRDAIAETRARLGDFAGPDEAIDATASAWAEALPPDTFVVAFEPGAIRSWPAGRLLFAPVEDEAAADPAGVFAAGEVLEFRDGDPAAAIEIFRRLSDSDDPEIRAGALLRLARNLRKAGRHHDALAAYERLLECGSMRIVGGPAALLALQGKMATWEQLGDQQAAAREARLLRERLRHPDWLVSRGTFELYWASASKALTAATGEPPETLDDAMLAAPRAVEALWNDWRAGREPGAALRADTSRLIVGQSVDEMWIGLIGGAAFLDAMLVERAEPLLARHRAALVFLDLDGLRVAGTGSLPAATSAPVARRTPAETGLPWSVRVFSADLDGELALLAGRRSLLAAGLVVMAALVIAGGVLSARSVRRELEVADMKSNVLAAVSHEFRTPLTLLRQTTEALADGRVDDTDVRRRYYDRQLRATNRLQRLVEGMLDFARWEAGALDLVATTFDAGDWLREVTLSFKNEAEGHGARVLLDETTPGVDLHADREALTRALWNLLDNAIKYSPEGSPVEVRTRRDARSMIIEVHDRGPGIDPGEREAIFEKFARGRRAVGQAQGTGLGLAMAREIARAHGGDVIVRARSGGGSTFALSLQLGGTP